MGSPKMTYDEFKSRMMFDPGFKDKVNDMLGLNADRSNEDRAAKKRKEKRRAARKRLKR